MTRGIWAAMGALAFGTGAISHSRERAAPPVESPAVHVRYSEGTLHGFLELTKESGALLAHGDLLQVVENGDIATRMVFHFGDGSVFEESATFSQHDVFTMKTYHLVQSGNEFAEDLDASLSRSGSYSVKTKSHKDGVEKTYSGTIALPADVYNGMIPTVALDVSPRESTTVHIVAFMPEPRVIAVELQPSPAERVHVGTHEESSVRFTIKPKLGFLLTLGAKLTGRMPPDSHLWIVTDDVPAFVRSEGPMYNGPVWRVALASPSWRR